MTWEQFLVELKAAGGSTDMQTSKSGRYPFLFHFSRGETLTDVEVVLTPEQAATYYTQVLLEGLLLRNLANANEPAYLREPARRAVEPMRSGPAAAHFYWYGFREKLKAKSGLVEGVHLAMWKERTARRRQLAREGKAL
jgi:hypothetical protein